MSTRYPRSAHNVPRLRGAGSPAAIAVDSPEAGATLMQRLRVDLRRLAVVTAIVIAAAVALGMILR